MRPHPLALLALTLLPACRMSSDLSAESMRHELSSRPGLFAETDVAQIQGLRPDLRTPFRLAIAPPVGPSAELRWTDRGWQRDAGIGVLRPWSADEKAVLERWAAEFVEAGVLSEVVFVPSVLVGGPRSEPAADGGPGTPLLSELRRASARLGADAVLVVSSWTATDTWDNAAAVLYLTLVGIAFVPGSEGRVVTISEGVLVDVENEYVYATGAAQCEEQTTRPFAFLYDRLERLAEESRVTALDRLGADLRAWGRARGWLPSS